MTIDTPARLAVLGAGPIGLEAALYARFLGYEVIVIEQGRVAEHVQRWGHVKMLTPFQHNSSPLGLRALLTQDEHYQAPAADALLTGKQWAEQYLLPLAETDLLAEHLVLNTRVIGIGKEQVLKTDLESDLPAGDERGDWPFRILLRDEAGNERIEMVDGVLDCTGVYSHPNFAGHGGLPAVGELGLREQIIYHLPDILEADRSLFEDQSTLLIGAGLSAATAAIWLDELQQQSPATQFTWITRHEVQPAGPIVVVEGDAIPARTQLATQANEVAQQANRWHWGTHLENIARAEDGRFRVQFSGQLAGEHTFSCILALVGYRPDNRLFQELQIASCPIQDGVVDRTKSVLGEANYYLLGSKAWGRDASSFAFRDGLDQIRAAFAIIGDRPALDLYARG